MSLGAMQSQTYPYYGSNIPSKEPTLNQQPPLDYSYSPCRMQSPSYYNQNALPNFMSISSQASHTQVNGYNTEAPSFQHSQIPNQSPATPNAPIDAPYFSTQDPNQSCSFHQYAWLKSTAPENWWHNASAGNYASSCLSDIN